MTTAVAAVMLLGCGEDADQTGMAARDGATVAAPSEEIGIAVAPEVEAGKLVAAQSGCLACHRIGESGNDGPGPELTEIGARLPPAALARSVEIGPGIMPSYAAMKEEQPAKFRDLVAFLSALDGTSP